MVRLKVILVFFVPLVKPSTSAVNTKLTLCIFCFVSKVCGGMSLGVGLIGRSHDTVDDVSVYKKVALTMCIIPSPTKTQPNTRTTLPFPKKYAHVDLDGPERGLQLHLQQLGARAHNVVEGQTQAARDDGGRGGEAELGCGCVVCVCVGGWSCRMESN